MIIDTDFYLPQEAAKLLGVNKRQINHLIHNKRLSKKLDAGKIKISGKSVSKYSLERNQKLPRGYISMSHAIKNTDLAESVIIGSIDRKELSGTSHRSGMIIETSSFAKWFSFLVSKGRIALREQKNKIKGNISVKNILGIHQRPCCDLFNLSLRYQNVNTHFTLSKGDQKAHGEVLLDLVSLNACYKERLTYEIDGEFCEMCLLEMRGLFRDFDKYRKQPIIETEYDLKAIDEDIRLSRL